MKFSTSATVAVFAALAIAPASAFAHAPHAFVRSSATSLQAVEGTTTSTRGEFFSQMAGMVAASTVIVAFPGMAQAAKYGPIGASPSGVLDPKNAIVDDEVFKSSAVQNAFKEVKASSDLVAQMKSNLGANSQVNLSPILRKQFDFGKLRADLNTLNSAFDEETQRGTDRLIRGIMQDLTELETANSQKEGIERSERRVATMNAKLDKLQGAFDDLLAFAP